MTDALELIELTAGHGRVAVLDRLNLTIAAGEYAVLVGPSGGGKTTLLSVIAGLVRPNSGDVRFFGQSQARVPPHRRGVAMMFQNDPLYPHWTIRRTLAEMIRTERSRATRASRIDEVADRLGIREWLDRPPSSISGGELRRAALAKALIGRPAICLLDEPLSALDSAVRQSMIEMLATLPRERGADEPRTTILHVTHDGNEAMGLADRVLVLDRGRIVQSDPPERLYHQPETASAAHALGNPPANVLDVELLPAELRNRLTATASGSPQAVVVRPDAIRVTATGDPDHDSATDCEAPDWQWEAVVQSVRFAGESGHVTLENAPKPPGEPRFRVIAAMPWQTAAPLRPGERRRVSVAWERLRLVVDDRSGTMGQ